MSPREIAAKLAEDAAAEVAKLWRVASSPSATPQQILDYAAAIAKAEARADVLRRLAGE